MTAADSPGPDDCLLADKLNALLELTGLTADRVARKAGVKAQTLSNWRSGKTVPRDEEQLLEVVRAAREHVVMKNIDVSRDSRPLLNDSNWEGWRRKAQEAKRAASARLAERAQAVYAGLDSQLQKAVPEILLRLVDSGESAEATLRSARKDAFAAEQTAERTVEQTVEQVLRAFTEAGILVWEDDRVTLSSAALIHAWPDLHRWVEDSRDGLIEHRRLSEASRVWDDHGRNNSDLFQGRALERALALTEPGSNPTLNPTESAFVHAGSRLAVRHGRLRTLLSAVLAVLLVVAVSAAAVAFKQRQTVVGQRDRAASAQAAGTAMALRRTDPQLARRLAVAAHRLGDTSEAWSALLALREQWERKVVKYADFDAAYSVLDSTGTILAVARDRQVETWNTGTGTRLGGYTAPSNVRGLQLSGDGSTVALRYDDHTHILNAQGLRPRNGHSYRTAAAALSLSATGRYLAVGGSTRDGYAFTVWDTRTGAEVLDRAENARPQVSFSPAEKIVSVTTETRITWVDLATRKEVRVPDFHLRGDDNPGPVTFSADGKWAGVPTNRGGTIASLTEKYYSDLAGPPKDLSVRRLYFSPDSKYVALNGAVWTVRGAAASQGPVVSYPSVPSECTDGSFRFSADSTQLRCVGYDGVFRSVDISRFTKAAATGVQHLKAAASRDGSTLALPHDGKVRVWSTAPLRKRLEIPLADPGQEKIILSPNGRLLAMQGPSTPRTGASPGGDVPQDPLEIWDLTRNTRLGQLPASIGAINTPIAFSPDGRSLAHFARLRVEGSQAVDALRFWDLTTMKLIREVPAGFDPELLEFRNVHFMHDGKSVVASPQFGRVAFPSGKIITRASPGLSLDGVTADGSSLYTDPDNSRNGLTLFDPTTLRPLGPDIRIDEPPPDSDAAPAHTRDGRLLAVPAGGAGQLIKVWDVSARRQLGLPLTGHQNPIKVMAFTPDGSTLVSVDEGGRMLSRSIAPDRLAAELCTESGPPTRHEWTTHLPDIPYRKTC